MGDFRGAASKPLSESHSENEAISLLADEIERLKAWCSKLTAAATMARAVVVTDRQVALRSYTNFRTGEVDDLARPLLATYDAAISAIDDALIGEQIGK